jgi:hypothetical protein
MKMTVHEWRAEQITAAVDLLTGLKVERWPNVNNAAIFNTDILAGSFIRQDHVANNQVEHAVLPIPK